MAALVQSDWLAEFSPARSLPLDQEAIRIYERAYCIGLTTETPDEPAITFSTVALALLTGNDETSRWFAQQARVHGPMPERVAADKDTSLEKLLALDCDAGRPAEPRLPGDKQLLTASARAVLETAEEWANRAGGTDIGVRHLLAAYVLNPPAAHRRQMNEWGYNERAWRDAFFAWVAPRYTAETWTDARQRVAPTKAMASFEQPRIKGEALDFPGDAPAMQVLERAARYHAGRTDTWLKLQTLFFALVEEAAQDEAVRSAVQPLWDAAEAIRPDYEAALAAYLADAGNAPGAGAARNLVPFGQLVISTQVLNGLEAARGLARAVRPDSEEIGVLPLAGALVSRRVDNDADLVAIGLAPQALRSALVAHAVRLGDSADVWREALGEEESAPQGRPVDLNSDEPEAAVRMDQDWTSDPLRIRADVASFAALLASRSLEPPLAIGLFGPWGSGKTTFLKRLRLVIDERAKEAREALAASQPTSFVGNVVHVEFNAWHFAEDALISSLVDTIVRQMQAFIRGENAPVGQALLELKSQTAEAARRKAEAARRREEDARQAVKHAREELARSEARARDGAVLLKSALHTAWVATVQKVRTSPVVKDSGVLEQLGSAVADTESLQARVLAVRSRPARLLGDLGWKLTLVFALLVLLLPPLLAAGADRLLGLDVVGRTLTTAAALLSTAGVWLRAASGATAAVDRALAQVVDAYDQQVREDPQVKSAEARIQRATADAQAAAADVAANERELRAAESAVAAAALPMQMLSLVSARAEDRTYAKELTTISTARGDLQLLSGILRDQLKDMTAAQPGVRKVDRVILYIDDLDRCKPADVVRVLQVVHMLLAFELFVVVVAVDARWVEESLRQSYTWLAREAQGAGEAAAGDAGHVTPQDYLEKIFQIAFWLEPMSANRAAEYLRSLVRASAESDSVVQTIELDYMCALAAYVGPSPRRVKRLVNAYRLLKARMSDAQLRNFVTDATGMHSGPYQLVLGLLAIGTGAPASASRILQDLAERDPNDTFDEVLEAFRGRNHPDWTMAAQVLLMVMRTQRAGNVAELRGWARRVGRFLLHGPAEALR